MRAEWVPDVLSGYLRTTVPLGTDPDGEGELAATVVRRADSVPAARAVLAVHGFTDYFFQYRTGRPPHRSRVSGSTDLICTNAADPGERGRPTSPPTCPATTATWVGGAIIAAENQRDVRTVIYGHSTGGLVVSMWLDRVRRRGDTAVLGLAGLVLNSPFLDLRGPAILRTRVTSTAIGAVSRVRKTRCCAPAARAVTA